MDDGQMVPQDPDANPFIDNEAIKELSEKVVDTLRSLGLTVDPDGMVFQVHPEMGMMVMIPALVRPSAKEKMDGDKKTREEFNQMMATQAEAKLDESVEDDDSCKHENMHPSGFCMDCNFGMEE